MTGFQYYLPYEEGVSNALVVGIVSFFSYIILYNTLVPISLYVSVEMIRYTGLMYQQVAEYWSMMIRYSGLMYQ